MNKTDINYLKDRIESVVRCTNGTAATIINTQKLSDILTTEQKIKFITIGKAVMRPVYELSTNNVTYNESLIVTLCNCYTYPLTTEQKRVRIFNKRLMDKQESVIQEITLAGKRLLDQAVLGLIKSADIPEALHILAEMANSAK